MHPKYMNEFANQLQFVLIKSLKRKGNCIKRGKFTISSRIEQYLIRKFQVTRRYEISNILDELRLDQIINKDSTDPDRSSVSDFKIRLGRKSVIKYNTTNGSQKITCLNSTFYWEFIRIIRMAESNNKITVFNWKRMHEAHIFLWATKVD